MCPEHFGEARGDALGIRVHSKVLKLHIKYLGWLSTLPLARALATVQKVARGAGASRQAMYKSHFASKAELVLARRITRAVAKV